MRLLLIIGAGGFIGSIARYLVQQGISKIIPVIFPYGTLVVNISGCFLIGVFYVLAEKGNVLSAEWRVFLTTGFCGGFTTFSTFSYEAFNLVREDQFVSLSLYISMSVIFGVAATYLAIILTRLL
jgi:CrcB protein